MSRVLGSTNTKDRKVITRVTTEIIERVGAQFDAMEVIGTQCAHLQQELQEISVRWIRLHLDFTEEYTGAYATLKNEHNGAAVKALNERVRLTDKSAANAVREVAKHARLLREHVETLPPHKEALVALARAEGARPGSLIDLIEAGQITRTTTVREIYRLTRSRERTQTPATVIQVPEEVEFEPAAADASGEPEASEAAAPASRHTLTNALRSFEIVIVPEWPELGAPPVHDLTAIERDVENALRPYHQRAYLKSKDAVEKRVAAQYAQLAPEMDLLSKAEPEPDAWLMRRHERNSEAFSRTFPDWAESEAQYHVALQEHAIVAVRQRMDAAWGDRTAHESVPGAESVAMACEKVCRAPPDPGMFAATTCGDVERLLRIDEDRQASAAEVAHSDVQPYQLWVAVHVLNVRIPEVASAVQWAHRRLWVWLRYRYERTHTIPDKTRSEGYREASCRGSLQDALRTLVEA